MLMFMLCDLYAVGLVWLGLRVLSGMYLGFHCNICLFLMWLFSLTI